MADSLDNEILEMAVAREVDANRFYLAFAARVKDPRVKNILEKLAAEELEHKATIELEIMKTGRVVGKNQSQNGLRDKQLKYLPSKITMNYKEILVMGLKKEEESIKLYVDLAEMASEAHSKEILLALAREEAGHKLRFQKALDFLSHIA